MSDEQFELEKKKKIEKTFPKARIEREVQFSEYVINSKYFGAKRNIDVKIAKEKEDWVRKELGNNTTNFDNLWEIMILNLKTDIDNEKQKKKQSKYVIEENQVRMGIMENNPHYLAAMEIFLEEINKCAPEIIFS